MSGTGGNGTGTGGNGNPGGTGGGVAGQCGAIKAEASLGKKPVDIIVVIDNSGSMQQEIIGVEKNINSSFSDIIRNSGLDYRVILLSEFGDSSDGDRAHRKICVSAPLSGNVACPPMPGQMTMNSANFFHYSTFIDSTDSFSKILNTYKNWNQWLRPDAFKVFIEITDDNERMSAQSFEAALFKLSPAQFGTSAATRNYLMHAITGLADKAVKTDAYLPNEPVVPSGSKCSTGQNSGISYQNLAILTGGLRFPVCAPDNYNVIFKRVAEGIVAGAQVACEFAIPKPPAGTNPGNKVIVNYTPGSGGAVQSFESITDKTKCGPGKFYVESEKVYFCSETCNAVKADPAAKVEVIFTCEPQIG
jgi:hypothetical protein